MQPSWLAPSGQVVSSSVGQYTVEWAFADPYGCILSLAPVAALYYCDLTGDDSFAPIQSAVADQECGSATNVDPNNVWISGDAALAGPATIRRDPGKLIISQAFTGKAGASVRLYPFKLWVKKFEHLEASYVGSGYVCTATSYSVNCSYLEGGSVPARDVWRAYSLTWPYTSDAATDASRVVFPAIQAPSAPTVPAPTATVPAETSTSTDIPQITNDVKPSLIPDTELPRAMWPRLDRVTKSGNAWVATFSVLRSVPAGGLLYRVVNLHSNRVYCSKLFKAGARTPGTASCRLKVVSGDRGRKVTAYVELLTFVGWGGSRNFQVVL